MGSSKKKKSGRTERHEGGVHTRTGPCEDTVRGSQPGAKDADLRGSQAW